MRYRKNRHLIWPVAALWLRGIDKRLRDKMGIEFHVADDPLHAVARGTGIALKNIDKFNFLIR